MVDISLVHFDYGVVSFSVLFMLAMGCSLSRLAKPSLAEASCR